MSCRREPAAARPDRRRRFVGAALALLALGVGAVVVQVQQRANQRAWSEHEAEEAAQRSARQQQLATAGFDETLAFCQAAWRDELGFHHSPSALAWTHQGLDGYFVEGDDRRSLRQLRCDASGVRRGPRVLHPLLERLVEATAEGGVDSTSAAHEQWQLAIHRLSAAPRDPLELGVELIQHPLTGVVHTRRWRGVEGPATAVAEPAGVAPFALLIADPAFELAADNAPPAARAVPRHHWLREPEAAFDVIERALPAGARIVEITLTDERIELRVESPTPAFDDRPPTPYGDLDFDEYGIAGASYWYPREIPGFGCTTGAAAETVRRDYFAAHRPAGKLLRAWYSCSPAFSDGRRGTWKLTGEGPAD